MRKLLTVVAATLSAIVLLIVGAAALAPFVVGRDAFKDAVTASVREATGRDLRIDGDIELSVLPRPGIRLSRLTLGNPQGFGDQPFAEVESAQVSVRLPSLFKWRLDVDTVRAEGVRLRFMRDKGGRGNWEGLMGQAASDPVTSGKPHTGADEPGPGSLGALAVGRWEAEGVEVLWDDQLRGRRVAVRGLGIEAGGIGHGEPVDLRMGFDLESAEPEAQARVEIRGRLSASDALAKFRLDPLRVSATGLLGGLGGRTVVETMLELDLAAGQLLAEAVLLQIEDLRIGNRWVAEARLQTEIRGDVVAQAYRLDPIRLSVVATDLRASVPPLRVEAGAAMRIDLPRQTVAAEALELSSGELMLTGAAEGRQIRTTPVFEGTLRLAELDLRRWLEAHDLPVPPTADPAVLRRVGASSSWVYGADQLRLDDLHVSLDESALRGSIALVNPVDPGYRFRLELDRLDLDRYLPGTTAKPEQPATPAQGTPADASILPPSIPPDLIRKLDLEGRLGVGELILSKIRIRNAVIDVKSPDARLAPDDRVDRSEGERRYDSQPLGGLPGTPLGHRGVPAGESGAAPRARDSDRS